MSKNDGGPAFPTKGSLMFYFPEELRGELENIERTIERSYTGLTLRDWFAGQALAGVGAWTPLYVALTSDESLAARAEWAYRQSDAMLAERSKP